MNNQGFINSGYLNNQNGAGSPKPMKKETDFIFRENNKLAGIELKWQNKVNKSDFNNFGLFKNRILLSKKDFEFKTEKNLLIIPAYLFLSLI